MTDHDHAEHCSAEKRVRLPLPTSPRYPGGGDVQRDGNTGPDTAPIGAGPDLTITKSHTGNFIQGQTGTYTGTITNTGQGPTMGLVTVIQDPSLRDLYPCPPRGQAGRALNGTSCSRSDSLAPGSSYPPITLTVKVAANAPASITNTVRVSGGGDTDEANNTASDPTAITLGLNSNGTKPT